MPKELKFYFFEDTFGLLGVMVGRFNVKDVYCWAKRMGHQPEFHKAGLSNESVYCVKCKTAFLMNIEMKERYFTTAPLLLAPCPF